MKDILQLVLFILLFTILGCERTTKPYGGVESYNENPPYTVEVDPNSSPAK